MPIVSDFLSGNTTSGGIYLAAVSESDIYIVAIYDKAYISWKDPKDITVSDETIIEWAGTLVVRKAGSAPANRWDGTIVVDSKTRNAYRTSFFCDSGLNPDTTYYYKFFPYTTKRKYTNSDEGVFEVTPNVHSPADITGLTAVASGNGKVTLTWTDPDDELFMIDDNVGEIMFCNWGGTYLVYKDGSEPLGEGQFPITSLDDGTIAVNSTVRNQYKSNGFTVSGLTNGVKYYFSAFPYATKETGGEINLNPYYTSCTPNRFTIENVPSQSGYLTYNGSSQLPTWSNYDETQLDISITAQINAGTHTATFTPKDDYMWSDGTTAAKSVEWVIDKAPNKVSVSKKEIALDSSTLSDSFTVTRLGNGAITAISSNTKVATVAVSGTTVTVSSVNNTAGTAYIEVIVDDDTNYWGYDTISKIKVTCAFATASVSAVSGVTYSSGFSNMTPDSIKKYAEAISNNSEITNETSAVYIDDGDTHVKLSVGDQISVGYYYDNNYTNVSMLGDATFDLIGFNHDDLSDANAYGSATATSKAGMTFLTHDCIDNYYMAETASDDTTWANSDMRSLLATFNFDGDFRDFDGVKSVNKKFGLSRYDELETTVDKIFLLSEWEVFGSSDSYICEGEQYAYYKAGNIDGRIKYLNKAKGNWWTRSIDANTETPRHFCYVSVYGVSNSNPATKGLGLACAFCV